MWPYLYSQIPDHSHTYSQTELFIRSDEGNGVGNFYAHYRRAGCCRKVEGKSSGLLTNIALDAYHCFEGYAVMAIDRANAGARREVMLIDDSPYVKTYLVSFQSPLARDELFDLEWRARCESAVIYQENISDGYCLYTYPFLGEPRLRFMFNSPRELRIPRLLQVTKCQIVGEAPFVRATEPDGTFAYTVEIERPEKDAYWFGYEGFFPRAPCAAGRAADKYALSNGEEAVVQAAAAGDMRGIYLVQSEVESDSGLTEQAVIQRWRSFPDGLRVAIVDGRVAGYLQAVIWDPFQLSSCADWADPRLHHNPRGGNLFVYAFGVIPEQKGRGVEQALLTDMAGLSRRFCKDRIDLVCRWEDAALLCGAGFREEKKIPDYFCAGKPGIQLRYQL